MFLSSDESNSERGNLKFTIFLTLVPDGFRALVQGFLTQQQKFFRQKCCFGHYVKGGYYTLTFLFLPPALKSNVFANFKAWIVSYIFTNCLIPVVKIYRTQNIMDIYPGESFKRRNNTTKFPTLWLIEIILQSM